jgi:hypothetical protein
MSSSPFGEVGQLAVVVVCREQQRSVVLVNVRGTYVDRGVVAAKQSVWFLEIERA